MSRYEGKDIEAMASAPNYYRWIAHIFAPFIKGSVLEVGAGSGTFSELLAERPITELVAVEPSKEMYPILAERFRNSESVVCRQAFFPDICEQYREHFDTAVYINVLEHIADDRAELEHVHSALKDGGVVCIFVPALSWLFSESDRSVGHYRRYHKEPLRKLLEETGFDVVSIRYFDVVGVLPWLLFMKLMKKKVTGNSVAVYDSVVVPMMRRVEAFIPPPLGKNLIVIARKRR